MNDVNVGSAVTFVDSVGKEHPAIITAVWRAWIDDKPTGPVSSVNLVYVSDNPDENDAYGRQIKRETSCAHQSKQAAPGMYWK